MYVDRSSEFYMEGSTFFVANRADTGGGEEVHDQRCLVRGLYANEVKSVTSSVVLSLNHGRDRENGVIKKASVVGIAQVDRDRYSSVCFKHKTGWFCLERRHLFSARTNLRREMY